MKSLSFHKYECLSQERMPPKPRKANHSKPLACTGLAADGDVVPRPHSSIPQPPVQSRGTPPGGPEVSHQQLLCGFSAPVGLEPDRPRTGGRARSLTYAGRSCRLLLTYSASRAESSQLAPPAQGCM